MQTEFMLLKVSPCSHWIRLSITEPECEYKTECVCVDFLRLMSASNTFNFNIFHFLPHFLLLLPHFTASSFFFSSFQPLSNLPKYHNAFSSLFCFTCCVIDQCSPNARTPSRLQCVIAGLGCGPVEPICSISVSWAKCRSGRESEAKPTHVSRPVIPRWVARRGVRVCVRMEERVGGWFDKQCSHGWVLSEAAPGEHRGVKAVYVYVCEAHVEQRWNSPGEESLCVVSPPGSSANHPFCGMYMCYWDGDQSQDLSK